MRHDLFRFSGHRIGRVAVLIEKFTTGTHTGLIYFNEGSQGFRKLQVGIGNGAAATITTSTWRGNAPHVLLETNDEDEVINVAALCEVVSRRYAARNPEHMYGLFRDPHAYVEPQTGQLFLGTSVGVSCASFVLIVLATAGIDLVAAGADWPHRPLKDDVRHAELLDMMANQGSAVSHLNAVKDQLPCPRVAPEEVAGSCMARELPATQQFAERAAKWLLDVITASQSCTLN